MTTNLGIMWDEAWLGVGIGTTKYKFWKGVSRPWTLKLVLYCKMAWGWVFVGGGDFLSLFVFLVGTEGNRL